jgi:prepilin-type N-terminal cleavage/methylation domain-containing protein
MMRKRSGFTLIEILIVMAILVILAGLAVTRFGKTPRNRARSGALRIELRNIVLEQDIFYTKNKRYAKTVQELGFNPSGGTIVEYMDGATESGWRAQVTNPDATPAACSIFFGTAERIPPAETPGTINCQ